MSIKPVLVPDHDAAALRGLMDRFAEASTGPTKRQLTESRAAVAAAQGVAEGAFDIFKKLPPSGSTVKIDGRPVKISYGSHGGEDNSHVNFSWNDTNGKEHYVEARVETIPNLRALAKRIKGEMDWVEQQNAAQGVAEQQVDELSIHKMLKYGDAAEKDRDALNQKWDNRTASEKEKERVLRHEKGEQRAADKIKQKTGKLPVQIGKLDRLKHAITREGVAEGFMDTVKQAFNDCVVGYPQGTSEGQFIQGWARAIRAETGRDIPLEKLTRLYQDYVERSDEIMQSHGTTNEGSAEDNLNELDKSTLGSYVKKAAADVNTKSRDAQQHKDMWAGDFPVRGAKKQARQNQADIDKRVGGISRAVDRLAAEDVAEGVSEGDKSSSKKKSIGPNPNDPYEKGWRAAFKQVSNPYDKGTPDYKEWDRGHADHSDQPEHYSEGVTEAGQPDVMRHAGDTTVKVVKRGGRPIGEIGIDAEASEGNGQYYVKLYDGSYDAVGFDTAEEALAELKYAISEGLAEVLGTSPDRLMARTGMNLPHKFPRAGQTNLGNIPGTNLPDSSEQTKKYGQERRANRPDNLKAAIRDQLGKHNRPDLPESGVTEARNNVSVPAALEMLKDARAYLDQFDPEDDDDYFDAYETIAAEFDMESNDSSDDPLTDLLDMYEVNPQQAAQMLADHLQSQSKDVSEDDVDDFVAGGGKITQVKPNPGPRRSGVSLGSKHIGTVRGGKASSISGKRANTHSTVKPVVAVEQQVDEKSEAVRHADNPHDHRSRYPVDESVDPIEQLRADIRRFAQ